MGYIFNQIKKFLEGDYILFTTPGHKQGRAYSNLDNILKYDLTEVEGLDNIHALEGCILDSLKELSEFYGSAKSYYLLNGSTSGIHIMMFSCFDEYDEILVERGCHKSIIDAIFIRKLKINYINRDKYNVDLLVPNSYSKITYSVKNIFLEDIIKALKVNKKIKGVILTNPNYYGFYIDQKEIYEYLKNENVLLLIDSAHGAHIRAFNKELNCTNKFCDISIMSAHKTLPVLTQGAYMHVNNIKLLHSVDRYFSIFTTTSPSYLIMLSLENAICECRRYCDKSILLDMCNSFRDSINGNLSLYGMKNEEVYCRTNGNFYYDDSRICLKLRHNDLDAMLLYKYLFSKKIICEMVFFNGVVLIPTVYTKRCEMSYLTCVLNDVQCISGKNVALDLIMSSCDSSCKKVFEPYELQNMKFKLVKLEHSIGEVMFEDIFLYPPGTPIIFRGEEVLVEHVEIISEYIKNCYGVVGVSMNGYVKIVED